MDWNSPSQKPASDADVLLCRGEHYWIVKGHAVRGCTFDKWCLITPPSDGPGDAAVPFLKCPMCNEGFAGTDHTGEACDCHYCDGHGRITAQAFVEQRDRMEEIIGDNMTYEIRAEESKDVAAVLAEALRETKELLENTRPPSGYSAASQWVTAKNKAVRIADKALETWKAGK